MGKVAHTNNTKTIQHIGNKTIWPGETREVEETLVPGFKAKAPEPKEPEPNPVLAILDHNIAQITEMLPACSIEELDTLEQAEQDGKTRVGVMEALTADRLRRAAEDDSVSDEEMDAFAESLNGMSEEQLLEQLESHDEGTPQRNAVDAAIEALGSEPSGGNDGKSPAE